MALLAALFAALGLGWMYPAPVADAPAPAPQTAWEAPAAPAPVAEAPAAPAPVVRGYDAVAAPQVPAAPAPPVRLETKADYAGSIKKVEGGFVIANARGALTVQPQAPAPVVQQQVPGNTGSAGSIGNAGSYGGGGDAAATAAPQTAGWAGNAGNSGGYIAPTKEIPGNTGNAGARAMSPGAANYGGGDVQTLGQTAEAIKGGQVQLGGLYNKTR